MRNCKFFFVCLSGVCLFFTAYVFGETNIGSNQTTTMSKSSLSFDQIKLAAENGDADAQYALGYMYYYGKNGVTKDNSLARVWIGKAAAQKQTQAMKAIALMNGKKPQQEETKQVVVVREAKNEPSFHKDAAPVAKEAEENKESTFETKPEVNKNEKMASIDMRIKKRRGYKDEEEPSSTVKTDNAAYTLQLLGSSNKERIKLLVKEHHLTKARIYQTTLHQKDWYVLLYGYYPTKKQALVSAKNLEVELSVKPWVKSAESMKNYKLIHASS